jgi:hypothetical protein
MDGHGNPPHVGGYWYLREIVSDGLSNYLAFMEESPQPAQPDPPLQGSASLSSRLLNVLATPGDVFEEVKASKASAKNWLVPTLISSVVGIIAAVVLFSQPSILQQLREQQEQALEKSVSSGKMTREQMEKAQEAMEKFSGPGLTKLVVSISVVIASFVKIIWWGFVLWSLGRWIFKVQFPYAQAVEMAGLATMIIVLRTIVTLLLAVSLGNMFATPGLALFVDQFDPASKTHVALAAVNLFNIWFVATMAVALSKLATVSFAKAASVVFGFWVLLDIILIAIGAGQFVM